MSVWTDEAVATLREMWPEHSATEIVRALGGTLSRNAVIGKVHRLKLPTKKAPTSKRLRPLGEKPAPKKAKAKPKRRIWNDIRNVRPPMQIVAPPAPVEPLNLTLMQLGSGQCHYIAGEPSSGYCGHPAEELGRPYCAFHLRLCYRPLDPELSRRHRRSAEYMARVGA